MSLDLDQYRAVNRIVRYYVRRARWIAWRQREDAVQEIFLRLIRRRYDPSRGPLDSWLRLCVPYMLIDLRRIWQGRITPKHFPVDGRFPVEDLADLRTEPCGLELEDVYRLLRDLERRDRRIVLAWAASCPVERIAERYRLSRRGVFMIVSRSLSRMRRACEAA